MDKQTMNRRTFLSASAAGTLAVAGAGTISTTTASAQTVGKLAIQGGKPVRTKYPRSDSNGRPAD